METHATLYKMSYPSQWGIQISGGGGVVIQIRRLGGGGAVSKNFFSDVRASVWSKIKGGPPLYPPLQAEAFLAFRSSISLHDTYLLTCYLRETISETCVPTFAQISTELLTSAIGRVIHTIRHCRGIGNRASGISLSLSSVRCLRSDFRCLLSDV